MMRKERGCASCAQDESASHKRTETHKVSISSSVTQLFIFVSELHNCMENKDLLVKNPINYGLCSALSRLPVLASKKGVPC
jgi:hypothetical protein